MFVCVAGKNDISVEILEYLVERQEDRYEIGVVCNKNETGKDSWQKSLRYHAKKKWGSGSMRYKKYIICIRYFFYHWNLIRS